MDLSNSIF